MAAEEYVPVEVGTYVTGGGVECWRIVYNKPSGYQHVHVFPKMTLCARAAEYGIDPTDVDTLLDIVLHEPFTPSPADPLFDPATDPAVEVAGTTTAVCSRGTIRRGDRVPPWLYEADDVAQARAAHLARIAHCKEHRVRIRGVPRLGGTAAKQAGVAASDPLDVIRRAHHPDPVLIDRIRQEVEVERRRLRGEQISVPLAELQTGSIPVLPAEEVAR